MNNIAVSQSRIPAMSDSNIEKIRELEASAAMMPQVPIATSHVLHAGMYARTVLIPAGVLITGAQIKCATILIVSGEAAVSIGDKTIELRGYNVIAASKNRKQAFLALTDIYLTMLFPTEAKSVYQAEEEFTDEAHLLSSRNDLNNNIIITGE